MSDTVVTPEVITGEARFILQHLATGEAEGKANHMADVRDALAGAVTLDFADYLKFLKKFNYITLNRQTHTLGLTEDGGRVVEGYDGDRFTLELTDYFAHRLEEAPAPRIEDEPEPATVHAGSGRGAAVHDTHWVKYDAVGSGGLGTVYRGRHTTLGTEVAIKEIKDLFSHFAFLERGEVARRLETAVTAQAALRHPGIVEILDLDPDVAHPFFVMAYQPGGSVREVLRRKGGGLPVPVVLRYLHQALHALRAAHAEGVLHKNLKPENLLLDAWGNVRLGDFGLSSVLEVDASRVTALPNVFLSTTGMAYLAPEQVSRGDIGPTADLYGLGILLYELLVGQAPGRRAPLPSEAGAEVPKGVDALFDRLTRDDPKDRYPDADAVLGDVYALLDKGARAGKADLVLYTEAPDLGLGDGDAEAADADDADPGDDEAPRTVEVAEDAG